MPTTPDERRERYADAIGNFMARECTICGDDYEAADAVQAVVDAELTAQAAEARTTALAQAVNLAHTEAARIEAEFGAEAAHGARCVAHLLIKLADTNPEMAASLTRDGFGPSEIARQTDHAAAARPDKPTKEA